MKIKIERMFERHESRDLRCHLIMISTTNAKGELVVSSLDPYVVRNPKKLRMLVDVAKKSFAKAFKSGEYSGVVSTDDIFSMPPRHFGFRCDGGIREM